MRTFVIIFLYLPCCVGREEILAANEQAARVKLKKKLKKLDNPITKYKIVFAQEWDVQEGQFVFNLQEPQH